MTFGIIGQFYKVFVVVFEHNTTKKTIIVVSD